MARADRRMVGIEVFNGGMDYGGRGGDSERGWYAYALDRGWHVGAVGAEDTASPRWGIPEDPKTVVRARRLTRPALRAALLRRSFYAIRRQGVRLRFTVAGSGMGSRLRARAGKELAIVGTTNVQGARLELVTSGGEIVASGGPKLSVTRRASGSESWYFLRARDAEGGSLAYSSPIWVGALPRG